jgi:hypothetical protein
MKYHPNHFNEEHPTKITEQITGNDVQIVTAALTKIFT